WEIRLNCLEEVFDVSALVVAHGFICIAFHLRERALTPALPLYYFSMNSFQSAMPGVLRMSADTGNSFGARGTVSSFRPASCGRRLPLRVFTSLLDHTRFSHASAPPRERGK